MTRTCCIVIPLFAGMLAASGGCYETGPEGQKLLDDGKLLYQQGDDPGTVETMDVFLRDYGRTRRADEAYYYRGLARYRLGRHEAARADLEEALDRTWDKPLRVGALAGLGDLAYDMDDSALAEQYYLKALDNTDPEKPPSDHIRYRLGCTYQMMGRWEDADKYFDRVIYLFKGSQFAERSMMRVRSRAWTVQVGAFGTQGQADAAARKLEEAGKPAFVRAELRDKDLVFLVGMGKYPTFDEARSHLQEARGLYSDAFITTTR